MMYILLLGSAVSLLLSIKFYGPLSWVLGLLGIVLLVSSYLWEIYRKA